MDYDLIVVKTLERVYKNYYYIIRGEKGMRLKFKQGDTDAVIAATNMHYKNIAF